VATTTHAPEWVTTFLADLSTHGQVSRAALAAGVNVTTVLRFGRESEAFATDLAAARERVPAGAAREIRLP
jgi:hypothetical protein